MTQLRFLPLAAALLAAPVPFVLARRRPPRRPRMRRSGFNAFLDAEFGEFLKSNPQAATQLGSRVGYDRLNDQSEAAEQKELQWRRGSVARMKAQFKREALPLEGKISYDMWSQELDQAELAYRFRRHDFPLGGKALHSGLPSFLISSHLVDSASDMAAYNARIAAIGPVMDQVRERAVAAAGDGIRMPRFQYERVIAESKKLISGQPFDATGPDSALWADAKAKVAKLRAAGKVTPAEGEALLEKTKAALITGMKPGYQRLIAWAQGDIGKAPSGKVGALTLPDGAAWYQAALKLQTTTDFTPEQVHQLGLSEVKRVQAEQDALARSAGFKDAAAYYVELARIDPPAPYTDENRAEILSYSNGLIAKTREQLPKMFNRLPAYRVEVIREPAFSEVPGGAAHASGPSPDGARPGRVYLHMLGRTSPRASLADLMCHEASRATSCRATSGCDSRGAAVPAGGAQRRLQRGLGALLRALVQGDGRLSGHRVGLHAPGRRVVPRRAPGDRHRPARQGLDRGPGHRLPARHRPPGEDQARAETRRYIVNPGQATAYKIGMIRILQLRTEAQTALGPKFDVKAFNDVVIGSGSLPLSVLERRVRDWVAERKG
jgi:uncharacterized protein (DUF885 family)